MGKQVVLTDTDKSAVSFFIQSLPYYFSLENDVPSSVKFQLLINKFVNVFDAVTYISKNIQNKTANRLVNKLLTSFIVSREITPEIKEGFTKLEKYL